MRTALKIFNTDLLIALFSMLLICVFAHAYSYSKIIDQQDAKYQTTAQKLTIDLATQLTNAQTFLQSLSQVTHLSQNLNSIDYEELMRPSGFLEGTIRQVGKFERVPIVDKDKFLSGMKEKGNHSFRIIPTPSAGSQNGRESVIDGDMLPVTSVFPGNVNTAKLVGIDLHTNKTLLDAFYIASSDNRSQIIGHSKAIFGEGNFLMMHPHYLGRVVADNKVERMLQASGGFIADIDFSKNIKQTVNAAGLNAALVIADSSDVTGESNRIEYLADVSEKSKRYFSNFLKGYSYSSKVPASNNQIELQLQSPAGIAQEIVRKILISDVIALVLAIPIGILIYFLLKGLRQHKDVESRLASTRAQAFKTLNSIDDAVITVDYDGKITSANTSANNLLGNSNGLLVKDILNLEDKDSISGNSRKIETSELLVSQAKGHKLSNVHLHSAGNEECIVDINVKTLNDVLTDETTGHVVVIRDVSEVYKMAEEIEYRTSHDSLTNLPNRDKFESILRKSMEKTRSSEHDLALIYIDLDQFKLINDTCGHGAGDALLVKISTEISEVIGKSDLLARLGGDEFGILVHNKSYDEAIALGQRLKTYFQDCYFTQGEDSFAIRASLGFVYIDEQFSNPEDVMSAADIACYTAKDRGRNDLYEYKHNSEVKNERKDELLLLPKLQNALKLNDFTLYVQSIVPLKENDSDTQSEYSHYEILLRMIDDEGKIFTPYQLIVAAERYDLMRDVDRWVISNAFENIAQLNKTEYSTPENLSIFSINISGQSAADTSLCDFIDEQLALHAVFPAQLCFELTETTAIGNMAYARAFVDFLHDRGCSVALDDFGSGVSTFGYLKNFPVDYLKIDGQFIKNIDSNPVDREMVRCMHAVAEIQGIKTIGEFVENKAIADILKELNVGYAQGYYYNKPFPFELLFSGDSYLLAA